MIPNLYKGNEINFNHNGLGFLTDCTSCKVVEEANGIYELEFTYPVGSFLFNEIKGQRIIKAKANDRYDPQLFRIYHISKPINGLISIKAEHISYRLKDNFIEGLSYTGNCAGILNTINNNAAFKTGFNFSSNLSGNYTVMLERRNLLSAILGQEGSLLQSLGNNACVIRDNFNFYINSLNQDNNVLISYKKNITEFKLDEDWSNCITKIYPYASKNTETSSEEITITLSEKYIESKHINQYSNPVIRDIDFTDKFNEDEEITEDTLRKKASQYFIETKCDIPKFTYSIELVALSKTEEYKDFILQEDIGLYDTLIVRHDIYNIDTKVKVIKTEYDSLSEMYTKIELGQPKITLSDTFGKINNNINNMNNTINNTKNELEKTINDALKDIVTKNTMDKAIKEVSEAITGYDGGYVRLNPPANPSEILVMDNEDINLARTVWRWNKEGLGVSTNGYNGLYTGLTKNGKLVINETTTNALTANFIKTQVIDSINTNSKYFHLDTETGAKFGDIEKGCYTAIGANGLEHVDTFGATPYLYITDIQGFSVEQPSGDTGSLTIFIPFSDNIKTRLNGKTPRCFVIEKKFYGQSSADVVDGLCYVDSVTANGFNLLVSIDGTKIGFDVEVRDDKYSYTNHKVTVRKSNSYSYGGSASGKVLILA